ncbi:GGDEF domain-containing protein [Streptomyces iranensis]|uniref:Diguanylate cyclase (GGDEF)-like protein n=1 Tax=Streptomyces iranensis TaxID=576784 RepID=A0A060ZZG6_9ACTN|nr:GGDEF domain-containing protein [Streptomyces iranensis]MBP2066719.1 diguanylate cyclase (GGDEF)-like protein [Streptomyces iranensis]CDR08539.1 diguanylate cyclase with PAS/PAC sensor [Streptomyces iranensis]
MSALHTVAAAAPLATGWAAHGLWFRRSLDRARRDPLTGLPTRAAFEKHAAQLLRKERCAVLLIDLDGFKALNDTMGHAAGDATIRAVGERLGVWVHVQNGAVGRLGGDEFAAVVSMPHPSDLPVELSTLHRMICEPVELDGRVIPLRASIGAYHGPHPAPALSVALRRADEAMYQAKQAGGGWAITDNTAPVYRTVNGRRDGRPGTSNEDPMSSRYDGYDLFEEADDYDDFEDEEFEDAQEWQPDTGQCDHCTMAPGEVIEPLGLCCACSIGQGAAPENCVCGPAPDNDAEGAS